VLRGIYSFEKDGPMNKKYLVRFTGAWRSACAAAIKNEKRRLEKLRRAMILLRADADGPG
jgi:hypothetical protein